VSVMFTETPSSFLTFFFLFFFSPFILSQGSLSFWDHTTCWLLLREERLAKFVVTGSMKSPRVTSFLCEILPCFATLQIHATRTGVLILYLFTILFPFFVCL